MGWFGGVYEAFEDVLGEVGELGESREGRDEEDEEEEWEVLDEEVFIRGIRGLFIKGLERAPRLRSDVANVLSHSKGGSQLHPRCRLHRRQQCQHQSQNQSRPQPLNPSSSQSPSQRPVPPEPPSPPPPPSLQSFLNHIRTSTPKKPHLLLAYTWVLYMALFSGGRYLRARLRDAGVGFWTSTHIGCGWDCDCDSRTRKGRRRRRMLEHDDDDDDDDEHENCKKEADVSLDADVDAYLTFWTFPGTSDGEDLKAEFKARFADIETSLTEGQKEEVVKETVFVMESVLGLVREMGEVLDTAAGRPGKIDRMEEEGKGKGKGKADRMDEKGREEVEKEEQEQEQGPSMRWLLLKHILPMGMVELISAAARSAVGVVGLGSSLWRARGR